MGAVRALIARRSLPGDTTKAGGGGASVINPNQDPIASPSSSGFTTSAGSGIKGRVRRLSGSGVIREEGSSVGHRDS